jgi:hypothetical protein
LSAACVSFLLNNYDPIIALQRGGFANLNFADAMIIDY